MNRWYRAGDDAEHGANEGQAEAEQHGKAETIEQPGQNVPAPVIGAQEVCPGWRRGHRPDNILVDCVVRMRIQRGEHPVAVCTEDVPDIGVAVVGLGVEITAENGFRIGLEDGQVEITLEIDKKRFVVADQFGAEADDKKH